MFWYFHEQHEERRILKTLIQQQEIMMAKIDDLALSITTLQATADLTVAKINALKLAGATDLDPQLTAAIAALTDIKAKLDAAIA